MGDPDFGLRVGKWSVLWSRKDVGKFVNYRKEIVEGTVEECNILSSYDWIRTMEKSNQNQLWNNNWFMDDWVANYLESRSHVAVCRCLFPRLAVSWLVLIDFCSNNPTTSLLNLWLWRIRAWKWTYELKSVPRYMKRNCWKYLYRLETVILKKLISSLKILKFISVILTLDVLLTAA